MTIKGGCLCGAVRYETAAEQAFAGHCHCMECRKESGTGHLSLLAVTEESFSVAGDVTLFKRVGDSGKTITRAFCSKCGSTVYAIPETMPGICMIRAGTMDDPEQFKPGMSIYASRRPSWDKLDETIPSFADMPPSDPQ